MKQIYWNSRGQSCELLLFGHGLVGQAVVNRLARRSELSIQDRPWGWQDLVSQETTSERFVQEYQTKIEEGAVSSIQLLWSAGAGGFQSSDEALNPELLAFQNFSKLCSRLMRVSDQVPVSVHMISSAGGLFEGFRNVERGQSPSPIRPYGRLKLEQERILTESCAKSQLQIYRPSSIYGFSPGGRAGLIAALIRNALCRSVTNIFGRLSTLRDYVFVDDLADYIAESIFDHQINESTQFLVSGKATSLWEVIQHIEDAMSEKLFLSIDTSPNNASDNTYRPSVIPKQFRVTELKYGIIQTVRKLRDIELIGS